MKYAKEDADASGVCAWTDRCTGRAVGLVRHPVPGDYPRPFAVDVPVCAACRALTQLAFRPYRPIPQGA